VGVLAPAVNVIASLEVVEGLKILLGKEKELYGELFHIDVWSGSVERFQLEERDYECQVCGLEQFEFLESKEGSYLTSLCGRNAVQVNVRGDVQIAFPTLAERLALAGEVKYNDYMLRFRVDSVDDKHPYELTIFPDGRTIVKGTTDESVARTLYARYVGL
jgi:adenylyltransferase/sulfurtransferase